MPGQARPGGAGPGRAGPSIKAFASSFAPMAHGYIWLNWQFGRAPLVELALGGGRARRSGPLRPSTSQMMLLLLFISGQNSSGEDRNNQARVLFADFR